MSYYDSPGVSKDRRRVIADLARNLHLELWNNRHDLWPTSPSSPLHVVDPGVALEYLGYRVGSADLGQEHIDGRLSEVAGVIDYVNRSVVISTRPSREEQFFTAAHELGHAVLHPGQTGLHRDRPIKGPVVRKDIKESEADYFASCFLMPEKRVRASVFERFSTDHLRLDQRVAFGLCDARMSHLQTKIRSVREFSRLVVECMRYDGAKFRSMKSEYEVSTEAAAIRLEELDLISV